MTLIRRREFLKALTAAPALALAAQFPQQRDLRLEQAMFTLERTREAEEEAHDPTALEEATRYVRDAMEREFRGWRTTVITDWQRLGGAGIVHQFGFDIDNLTDGPDDVRRVLDCGAQSFALRMVAERCSAMAVMELPSGVEQALNVVAGGIAVRGLRWYNVQFDTMWTRFDVLVGRP